MTKHASDPPAQRSRTSPGDPNHNEDQQTQGEQHSQSHHGEEGAAYADVTHKLRHQVKLMINSWSLSDNWLIDD